MCMKNLVLVRNCAIINNLPEISTPCVRAILKKASLAMSTQKTRLARANIHIHMHVYNHDCNTNRDHQLFP